MIKIVVFNTSTLKYTCSYTQVHLLRATFISNKYIWIIYIHINERETTLLTDQLHLITIWYPKFLNLKLMFSARVLLYSENTRCTSLNTIGKYLRATISDTSSSRSSAGWLCLVFSFFTYNFVSEGVHQLLSWI